MYCTDTREIDSAASISDIHSSITNTAEQLQLNETKLDPGSYIYEIIISYVYSTPFILIMHSY